MDEENPDEGEHSDSHDPVEFISEDELDNWGADESNTVRTVFQNKSTSTGNDSDIEILEPPIVPSLSNLQAKAVTRKTPTVMCESPVVHQPLRQLHMPPQSSKPSPSPIAENEDKVTYKKNRIFYSDVL